MQVENTFPQQSLLKSILLHVLPGALVTIGFILLKPLLGSSGYPPPLAFLLAILLIDLPVMWGRSLHIIANAFARLALLFAALAM